VTNSSGPTGLGVYWGPTQAKAWARFPGPFGPTTARLAEFSGPWTPAYV
jgi:hypothetical protein